MKDKDIELLKEILLVLTANVYSHLPYRTVEELLEMIARIGTEE